MKDGPVTVTGERATMLEAADVIQGVTDPLVVNGLVDVDEINYVRLIDIPGTGAFKDSLGNSIYDASVTTGSGGFDLEAIGVLNAVPEPATFAMFSIGFVGILWARRRNFWS